MTVETLFAKARSALDILSKKLNSLEKDFAISEILDTPEATVASMILAYYYFQNDSAEYLVNHLVYKYENRLIKEKIAQGFKDVIEKIFDFEYTLAGAICLNAKLCAAKMTSEKDLERFTEQFMNNFFVK